MTAPVQAPPEAAVAFYSQGQAITAAVILALRDVWQQFDPANIEASFAALLDRLVAILGVGQVAAARTAVEYIPRVLEELGIEDQGAVPTVRPFSFVGASSGVTLPEMLETVPLRALSVAGDGNGPDEVIRRTRVLLDGIARTQVADAARQASATGIAVRPWVTGYVRMLNLPSCDRCILLAGKFYLWSDGFRRHEACDCRHIPADEDTANDLRTDPDAYFRSLTEAEQNAAFGKAKAEALRLGADMSQVVNTRGVQTAQVYGQRLRITAAGTSSRGAFGRQQRDLAKVSGQRYRRSRTPRLTPESIMRIAKDREDAIRLLKFYAYIT